MTEIGDREDTPGKQSPREIGFLKYLQQTIKTGDWQAVDDLLSTTHPDDFTEIGILSALRVTDLYRDRLPSWNGFRDRSAVVLNGMGVDVVGALRGLTGDTPTRAPDTRRDADRLLGLRRCRAEVDGSEIVLADDRNGDLVRWSDVEMLLRSLHVSRDVLPDPQVAVLRRLAIIRNLPEKPSPDIRCCVSGFGTGQMTNYALEAILAFEKNPVPEIVDPKPDPVCDKCGGPIDDYGDCLWILEERERNGSWGGSDET